MKVIVRPAVTLDGFIADLNGECYSWINPKDEERFDLELHRVGCELMGRRTYEQYKKSIDARVGIITFVYTRTPQSDTDNVKFVHGALQEVLQAIETTHQKSKILVSGGGEMNGALLDANLIDELYLSYHPILLGSGIRVFGSSKTSHQMEHVGIDQDVPGVVRHHYRVKR